MTTTTTATMPRRAAVSSVCAWPGCYQMIGEGTRIGRVPGRPGWVHIQHLNGRSPAAGRTPNRAASRSA